MKIAKKVLYIVLMLCMLLSSYVFQETTLAADNNTVILAKDAEWKYLDNGLDQE